MSNTYDSNGPGHVWLRRFANLVCLGTLCLIFLGGQVKSHEAGLSVPDWPLTYNQNPITYPISLWTGGIFHEHFHRLFAGGIAALTVVLAVWLYLRAPRPGIAELGYLAVAAVLVQAVLGGMTVLLHLPVWVSSAHAILAQTFFLITLVIAYALSRERAQRAGAIARGHAETDTPLRRGALVLIALVYVQLFLGALMRHTESGLAVPDFPTMGGRWLPIAGDAMLAAVNDWRFEQQTDAAGSPLHDVTLAQVAIHLAHRAGALAVVLFIGWLLWAGRAHAAAAPRAWRTLRFLAAAVVAQAALGIATVLTVKTPVITSLHVMLGAGVLGLAALMALRAWPLAAEPDAAAAPAPGRAVSA